MSCSVYVIGSPRGPQKIGVALNVARRLGALQTGSSVKLIASLVEPMATPEAKLVEAHAHWLLRDSRLSGEWFRVTPTDAGRAVREAIEAVARGEARGRSAVGRPKMDVKPMLVRLPEGVTEQIDAIAGPGKRAEFIRDAVEREIKRRSRQKD